MDINEAKDKYIETLTQEFHEKYAAMSTKFNSGHITEYEFASFVVDLYNEYSKKIGMEILSHFMTFTRNSVV